MKHEKKVKDGKRVLSKERYIGWVERSFTLADGVAENAAQAKYNNGVLELQLPKRISAKTKNLAIR